jgi:hypothetical protein
MSSVTTPVLRDALLATLSRVHAWTTFDLVPFLAERGIRAVPSRINDVLEGLVSDGRVRYIDPNRWLLLDPPTSIAQYVTVVAGLNRTEVIMLRASPSAWMYTFAGRWDEDDAKGRAIVELNARRAARHALTSVEALDRDYIVVVRTMGVLR